MKASSGLSSAIVPATKAAGMTNFQIRRHAFFRMALIGKK